MQTLLEIFERIRELENREAVRRDNGYRSWKYSYSNLRGKSYAFARRLQAEGVEPGDRVLVWGENSLEWMAVFWGSILSRVTLVPVDFQSSPEFAKRVASEANVRLAVCGDENEAGALEGAPLIRFAELRRIAAEPEFDLPPAQPDDLVEIVFTSGSTSEPRGVVHRHHHICSNLSGVAKEIEKYRRYAAPFQPIRFLDLLPLSHMFGQTMGLYIPPLVGGAVVFAAPSSGKAVAGTIRRQRVSVMISVPQMLVQLRGEIERRLGEEVRPPRRRGWKGAAESWWRYRSIHSLLGWKFWAAVVGGAPLDESLEQFFRHLGFVIVQGYGLTEASPVVSVNHPFDTRPGSIGKPLPGQEVRIAPDGEIVVRGASVATEYLGGGERGADSTRLEGGWLHTGDLGEFDSEGRLYYRGRKSDRIVRADGQNVYPRDVEAAVAAENGAIDSYVVGVLREGRARVHAALVMDGSESDANEIVSRANARLEPHQRIEEWSVWQEDELPRTPSTLKVRRNELSRMIAAGERGKAPPADSLPALLDSSEDRRLDEDLALSSLDRVELLSQIEQSKGVEIDEDRFASIRTTGELRGLVEASAGSAPEAAGGPLLEPRWARRAPVRPLRKVLLEAAIFPLSGRLFGVEAEGLEKLAGVAPPVLFAAAPHTSHFDTLALYRALPKAFRHRLTPAMSQDFFAAWFQPEGKPLGLRLKTLGMFLLASGLFNAYPLPQKLSGVRRALRYTSELVESGYCPLIYPEGTRSEDGEMLPFQPGAGLIARRMGLTVVPVRLRGLFDIYSVHHERRGENPRPGTARVTFGEPLDLSSAADHAAAVRTLEEAIRKL